MVDNYKFTQDWFSWAPPIWEQLTPMLPGKPGERNFLEIGSFEGRSTVWIIENMMADGDNIDCIDTWEGGEEHSNGEMGGAEERFDHNVEVTEAKISLVREVRKYKGLSTYELARIYGTGEFDPAHIAGFYDFIYIDGSHIAKDVLTDACMAWPLLQQGGIMVFDDYLWGDARDILHRPKPAIDAFVNIFSEEIEMIHMGYQLIIRKK